MLGSTSYHDIVPAVERVEIGYTWYARRMQRSAVNTTAKLLLLTHAFDTLGAQLDDSVELLERELPNAAEATARVLYYAGYLVMALMVCAMLVQMYAPYFQFHEMFLGEGL